MKSDHRAKRRLLAGVFVASAVAMIAADHRPPAKPPIPQQACDQRDNNSYHKLLDCVTLEGVREHQAGAAGDRRRQRRHPRRPTPRLRRQPRLRRGHDDRRRLGRDAGRVRVRPASTSSSQQMTPRTAPTTTAIAAVETGEGDVTGGIHAVDINLATRRDRGHRAAAKVAPTSPATSTSPPATSP